MYIHQDIPSFGEGRTSFLITQFEKKEKVTQQDIGLSLEEAKSSLTLPVTKAKPQEIRQSISKDFLNKNQASFVERSQVIWNKLIENNGEMKEKIDLFKDFHPEKLLILKEKGWKQLKEEEGKKMAQLSHNDGISMEEFRKESNVLIDELVNMAIKDLDLPEVDWVACGTPGYNSDVDIGIKAKQGELSLEEGCLLKGLRDCVHTFIFEGLSGTQLDTETYTPHAAESNTANKLSNPEAKKQFVTSECAMALLQGKIGMKDDPDGWKNFCEAEIASIDDPDREDTTREIIKGIDEWYDTMHFDILKQVIIENSSDKLSQFPEPTSQIRERVDALSTSQVEEQAKAILNQNPDNYKKAAANYRGPIMLQLAISSNHLAQSLIEKQNKLCQLREHSPANPAIATLGQECEKFHVQIDTINKIIRSLQDEGTLSQAEGNVTLFQEGGQLDQRKIESAPKRLKEKTENLEKLQNRIDQAILNSHIGNIREQLKAERVKSNTAPTSTELTLASHEEQQQLKHVFHEGLQSLASIEDAGQADKMAGKVAINAGKYCLRTLQNKLRAMQQVEKQYTQANKPLTEDFFILKEAMKEAVYTAQHLEQCKRKLTLNKESSLILLTKAILSHAEIKGITIDKQKVKKDLIPLLNKLQVGGELKDETLLKREKVNTLVENLVSLGYIDEIVIVEPKTASLFGEKKLPKNEGIRQVIQAMVGYSSVKESHADLSQLFVRADALTLKKFGLTTKEDVEGFSDQVENLHRSWQNMAFNLKVLSPLIKGTQVREQMNFYDMWQTAKQKVA